MRYREKRWSYDKEGKITEVCWIVYDLGIAVEFHCMIAPRIDPYNAKEIDGLMLQPVGFEVHRRKPFNHDMPAPTWQNWLRIKLGMLEIKKPDHTDCTVIGGTCYHDGSSLAASEFMEKWQGTDWEAFEEVDQWLSNQAGT